MSIDDGKQEVQVLHNWIYVIIPFGKYNLPLFSAYCKNCQSYFTEGLPAGDPTYWRVSQPKAAQSTLPKWGCINPMEGI